MGNSNSINNMGNSNSINNFGTTTPLNSTIIYSNYILTERTNFNSNSYIINMLLDPYTIVQIIDCTSSSGFIFLLHNNNKQLFSIQSLILKFLLIGDVGSLNTFYFEQAKGQGVEIIEVSKSLTTFTDFINEAAVMEEIYDPKYKICPKIIETAFFTYT